MPHALCVARCALCIVRCALIRTFATMNSDMENEEGRMLPVMEQFPSLQGEGVNTGKAAWFVRLGGCDVGCSFCDVKESWNPELHPLIPADNIVENAVQSGLGAVVLTGGEPLKWNLDYLTSALHARSIEIYLETSGSEAPSGKFDWICLSPKKSVAVHPYWLANAHELKVIIEEENDTVFAERTAAAVSDTCVIQLQPEWSVRNVILPYLVRYINEHPRWRLSVQTHKYIKIP